MVINDKVNELICPVFFGATLTALKKKNGIRPIAVGNTLRRLAAKIQGIRIKPELSEKLNPIQLGFGTPGEAEAAVHATRKFLEAQSPKILVKLDFKNAFNTINRNLVLHSVKEELPLALNYVKQCYEKPYFLVFNDEIILSENGVQQGDPMAPHYFA